MRSSLNRFFLSSSYFLPGLYGGLLYLGYIRYVRRVVQCFTYLCHTIRGTSARSRIQFGTVKNDDRRRWKEGMTSQQQQHIRFLSDHSMICNCKLITRVVPVQYFTLLLRRIFLLHFEFTILSKHGPKHSKLIRYNEISRIPSQVNYDGEKF